MHIDWHAVKNPLAHIAIDSDLLLNFLDFFFHFIYIHIELILMQLLEVDVELQMVLLCEG